MTTIKIFYRVKKQEHCLELLPKPFEIGMKKIKSALYALHPEYVCTVAKMYTTLLVSQKIFQKKGRSFMLEYHHQNKPTTLVDKSIFFDQDTLLTNWLATWARGLIGKEKGLGQFWNKRCQEESKKLWLPTETDFHDSPLNSLNSYLKLTKSDSSFSMMIMKNPESKNLQKISCQSYTSTLADKWVDVGIRTAKVRIYPTKNQQRILKDWMNDVRYTYNKTLEGYKNGEVDMNFMRMRDKYVTRKNNFKNVPEWLIKTPKNVRAGACQDLVTAFKAATTNFVKNNISNFDLKYKTKKNGNSIVIPSTTIKIQEGKKKVKIFPEFLTPIKLSNDKILNKINNISDSRIYHKHGIWTLGISYKKKEINNKVVDRTIALDPGVMTFQTGYSKDDIFKCQQDNSRFDKLNKRKDKLHSLAKEGKIKYSSYRKTEKSINRKADNLIDDLHFKTIAHLQSNYDNILLPSFDSQEMAKKGYSRKTNRSMISLKHYLFKSRLMEKCGKNKNCKLHIVSEAWTTKTCTGCGVINKKVKCSDRELHCRSCFISTDRDVSGSRNVFLRNINLC